MKVLTAEKRGNPLYSFQKPSYFSCLDHVSHILFLNILLKKEEIR
jgi:hypothetical protein